MGLCPCGVKVLSSRLVAGPAAVAKTLPAMASLDLWAALMPTPTVTPFTPSFVQQTSQHPLGSWPASCLAPGTGWWAQPHNG